MIYLYFLFILSPLSYSKAISQSILISIFENRMNELISLLLKTRFALLHSFELHLFFYQFLKNIAQNNI
ncbi:hypothetical protein HPK19_09825 [Arthrobacter citreus]|nr:hypothetical protein HPK19_09825 [Arthrobacter citreus]